MVCRCACVAALWHGEVAPRLHRAAAHGSRGLARRVAAIRVDRRGRCAPNPSKPMNLQSLTIDLSYPKGLNLYVLSS